MTTTFSVWLVGAEYQSGYHLLSGPGLSMDRAVLSAKTWCSSPTITQLPGVHCQIEPDAPLPPLPPLEWDDNLCAWCLGCARLIDGPPGDRCRCKTPLRG